jgi:glycosidase
LEDFYQKLLNLHSTNPALHARSEMFRLNTSRDASVFAFMRKKNEKEIIVILNFSDHLVRFDILNIWVKGNFREIFTGEENNFSTKKTFELKGWEYRVYEKVFEV